MSVYLDNSATTKEYPAVGEAVRVHNEDCYGNPSSLHSMGVAAEKALNNARKIIANGIGAKSSELYFTSGGTEADNAAIFGFAAKGKKRGNKIITTSIEHPAVLECCKKLENEGFEVVYLPVNSDAQIDLDDLREAIDDKVILITIMGVNNEVGTVLPLPEINKIKESANKNRDYKIPLHSDMGQGFMKEKIIFHEYADGVRVSAHKIHGPKGVGGLFIRDGFNLPASINGGGQERGVRSGTENTAGIVGFAEAVVQSGKFFCDEYKRISLLKSRFLTAVLDQIEDSAVNGDISASSPYILNISFLGIRAEVLLHMLEQDGIYVSTGSACSSRSNHQSHVLRAMGLDKERIEGAIRFSFGHFNHEAEIEYVIDKLSSAVKKLRRL